MEFRDSLRGAQGGLRGGSGRVRMSEVHFVVVGLDRVCMVAHVVAFGRVGIRDGKSPCLCGAKREPDSPRCFFFSGIIIL